MPEGEIKASIAMNCPVPKNNLGSDLPEVRILLYDPGIRVACPLIGSNNCCLIGRKPRPCALLDAYLRTYPDGQKPK